MLTSGRSYSIHNIFKDNITVVVPDMQREYCWAKTISDSNNKSLVSNFIESLIDNYSDNDTQMGLIYGYENPKNDIQLCDGQQRITTLYLTVGILHRLIDDDSIKKTLKEILVKENYFKNGILEPRLHYAIRESTLFFLRDLVLNYFLKNDKSQSLQGSIDITKEEWYFHEYNLDPSIQNILQAIDIIESMLAIKNIDSVKFCSFITNKLLFLYFDMENRLYGEEQFVVLNTTGKPLSITENIKPRFLGDLDDFKKNDKYDNKTELRHYADLWEEWEDFFWSNHLPRSEKYVADSNLNEFFRWIYIIEKAMVEKDSSDDEKFTSAQRALNERPYDFMELQFDQDKSLLLDKINKYYNSLQKMNENEILKEEKYLFVEKSLTQIQCFKMLPILSFLTLFETVDNGIELTRLIRFFETLSMLDAVGKATKSTVPAAIRAIKVMNDNSISDIIEIIRYRDQISDMLLPKEMVYKCSVLQANIDNREQIEKAFWKGERLKSCNGQLKNIFKILDIDITKENHDFPLADFINLLTIIEYTIDTPTDLMRRALLTFGDYSFYHGFSYTLGAKRLSFGTDYGIFRDILQGDSEAKITILQAFLKDLFLANCFTKDLIENRMRQMIDKYHYNEDDDNIRNKAMNVFIKTESVWKDMRHKLYCETEDEKNIYVLFQTNVTRDDCYKDIFTY